MMPMTTLQERSDKVADVIDDMKTMTLCKLGKQTGACLDKTHTDQGCGW
jgi:hypothetical protein